MKRPIVTALIYLALGVIFTAFAIRQVHLSDWGFFAYILVAIATIDLGAGIRILYYLYKIKSKQK